MELPHLAPEARQALGLLREERGAQLTQARVPVFSASASVRALTYAGGRINTTLKAVIESAVPVRVVADNFELRVEGADATREVVEGALRAVAGDGFFDDVARIETFRAGLPPYRLSKFQPLLPARFAREVIGRYFLDFEGTARFAREALQP